MNKEFLNLILITIQNKLSSNEEMITGPLKNDIYELISKDGKYSRNFTVGVKEKLLKMLNCKE